MKRAIARAALRAARTVSPRRTALIHGFYGVRNVGDDAILQSAAASVRSSGLDPVVVAWDPTVVREETGFPALSARGASGPLYRSMRTAGAFLLGGGGLIKDYGGSPTSLRHWMRGLQVAAGAGVPTMTWSVGVDPLLYPESERLVRETLSRVDAVTVRDTESAERLRDLGVRQEVTVTADPVPAYVARHRRDPAEESAEPHIAVALRHWYAFQDRVADPEAFDRALSALAGGLGEVCRRRGARVSFVPFRAVEGDDDRQVAARVAALMDPETVTVIDDPAPGIGDTIARLREADVVVGMRLHAAVIATTLGVPTVALSYAPKVSAYMDEVGLSDWCTDMGEVRAEWVTERVESALDQRARLRADLLSATDLMVEAYAVNGRILDTLT